MSGFQSFWPNMCANIAATPFGGVAVLRDVDVGDVRDAQGRLRGPSPRAVERKPG